jgi:Holliday junction resolvase-like predicted endonuclease
MLRGSNADENWGEIDLLGATETNMPVVVELKIKPREYLLRAIVEAAANGIAV